MIIFETKKIKMKHWVFLSFIAIAFWSCNSKPKTENDTLKNTPEWASKVIWYQIFPERFSNGDASNDPTRETMYGALYDSIPASWSITPWNFEWYKQEDWAKASGKEFYTTIQMRRYGGDIQGIINKIPYLKSLGITAVYLNPMNDAPSLHKYDARNFHHIDVTFGKSIKRDMDVIAKENPADPSTWKFTSADSMFVQLVSLLHKEGIKVVLDYSWNHTGTQFWAFKDIIKNQQKSPYKDWYEIKKLDDPNTPENEFSYEGWAGVRSLPELKKIRETVKNSGHPFEGNMPQFIKDHVFAVSKRWMDPNNDGNPADGIDGMRLDVAEQVPLGFWRDFRKYVRSVNPEFYLVGENWWTKWPDTLMDAEPWMRGDVFDAVMHYQWFKPARYLFIGNGAKEDIAEFYHSIDSIYTRYRDEVKNGLMNLGASHDSERMLTALANNNRYKFNSTPRGNPNYICWQPDSIAYQRMKALTLHQYTFVGAPHIFNGDEMGMWGSDDPDNRKPLWWPELQFDSEHYTIGGVKKSFTPQFQKDLFTHYSLLAAFRSSHASLQIGKLDFLVTEFPDLLAYTRTIKDETLQILINPSPRAKTIVLAKEANILFKTGSIVKNGKNWVLGPYAGFVSSGAK